MSCDHAPGIPECLPELVVVGAHLATPKAVGRLRGAFAAHRGEHPVYLLLTGPDGTHRMLRLHLSVTPSLELDLAITEALDSPVNA